MTFNDITNKYQHKLDTNLNKFKTYNDIVLKEVNDYIKELYTNKILQELYKVELKDIPNYKYDIRLEALTKILSEKNLNIKSLTRLTIYKKYPLLVYGLMIKNFKENILKIIDELLKNDINIYSEVYENLKDLENYYNKFESEIVKKQSALCIYNNFYGIKFKHISIKKDELYNLNYNMLIVNIGYNFKKPLNNVVYCNNNKYTQFFLNEELLKKYKGLEEIVIQPETKLYEIVDSKTKDNNLYSIVINYNNEYYSATENIYTIEEIELLNKGSVLHSFNKISFEVYTSVKFYEYTDRIDKNNLDMSAMKYLGVPLKTLYNVDPKKTIENWKNYIKSDRLLFENSNDKDIFTIYLDKLKQYTTEDNKLDLNKYINHVTNYFIIDIE